MGFSFQAGTKVRAVLVVSLLLGAAVTTALTGASPATAQTLLSGTALVANWGSNSVTPINTHTNTAGTAIPVGKKPDAIAIAPDGLTAYVANWGSDTVTPITLATGDTGTPIAVGLEPDAIAIAPDGLYAYVANFGSSSVTPIDLGTGKAESAISVGAHPAAIALSPSGEEAYVTSESGGTATEIGLAADDVVTTVPAGSDPAGAAVSSDGTTAYFVNFSSDTVTPLDTATNKAGTAIGVGTLPRDIALSPDGTTAYVSDFGSNQMQAIGTAEGRAGAPVAVGSDPMGLAVTPDDSTVYVADSGSNQVTPVAVTNERPETAITVGQNPDAIAITPGWTDQSFVPLSSTVDSVALAWFEGELWAFWTDETTGDEIFYSSLDGSTWSTPTQLTFKGGQALTNQGPAVDVDGGSLFVFWKGKQSGAASVWYSYFNGTSWSAQDRVNWGSSASDQPSTYVAPAVTDDDGLLIVAWTTTGGNVLYSNAAGPDLWDKPTQLSGPSGVVSTTDSPALTWSDLLDTGVAAWTNSSGTIGYTLLSDSKTGGTVPSAKTASAPALANTGEAVYVGWEGQTGNRIFYSETWPERTSWSGWTPQTTEPQALTNLKPAFAVDGSYVTVGWKGLHNDDVGYASSIAPY